MKAGTTGERRRPALGICVLLVAAAALAFWSAGLAGYEGTIVPQRIDFEQFHWPTIQRFASLPFAEAISDYGAAPFPLFYIVFGAVYAASHSLLVLHLLSALLGIGVLGLAWVIVRERFADDERPGAMVALLGFLCLSPYLRGQVIWTNTDVMPLLFMLAALFCLLRDEAGGGLLYRASAIVFSFLAFYTRQFYLFLPAYLAIRFILIDRRHAVSCFALCAVLSVPGLLLIALWHGVVPPSFAQHEQRPYPFAALPYVFANLLLYASPLIVVAAGHARDVVSSCFRDPRLRIVTGAVWLAYLSYFLLSPAEFFEIGGGLLAQLFQRLPVPQAMRFHLLAVATSLFIPVLVYMVAQDWRRNLVLVLFVACFLPTGIIFQRYFDPASVIIVFGVLHLRELRPLLVGGGRFAFPALEAAVAAIGFVHYGRLFGIF